MSRIVADGFDSIDLSLHIYPSDADSTHRSKSRFVLQEVSSRETLKIQQMRRVENVGRSTRSDQLKSSCQSESTRIGIAKLGQLNLTRTV